MSFHLILPQAAMNDVCPACETLEPLPGLTGRTVYNSNYGFRFVLPGLSPPSCTTWVQHGITESYERHPFFRF
jgi:hypothetical protein